MDRRLAPQVTADIIGGDRAYLLGWQRLPALEGGGWGARICWVEMTDEGAWLTKGGVVPARTVHQIAGQSYAQVPKDPTPTDPADPRDPKSRRRDHEAEYFRRMLERSPNYEQFMEQQRQMDGNF